MTAPLSNRLFAEALGSALLLAIVVGSGIMGSRLAGGNDAIALLGNTIATGAGLIVLILIFAPISGAHFNPAVSLVMAARGEIGSVDAAAYIGAQIVGALCGVALAHAMFGLDLVQVSGHARGSPGEVVGEAVATFGLLLTIIGVARTRPDMTATAVGLFIVAGYWFTSSTSFANPAVTVARMLTDTFAGIRPQDAPRFLIGQCVGAGLALIAAHALFGERRLVYSSRDERPAAPLS